MSTESDSPADGSNGEDSHADDEQSFHERARRARQAKALEAEGERLARTQAAMRLELEWDEETAERFHNDLVMFIKKWNEDEQLRLPEIGIALWDELSRVDTMLRQPEDEGDGNEAPAPDEGGRQSPQRLGRAQNDTHQTAPEDDPTFH